MTHDRSQNTLDTVDRQTMDVGLSFKFAQGIAYLDFGQIFTCANLRVSRQRTLDRRLVGQTCVTVKHLVFKHMTDGIIDKRRRDSCAQPLQPAQAPSLPLSVAVATTTETGGGERLGRKNPTHGWTSGSEVKQSMTEQPTDCVRRTLTDQWTAEEAEAMAAQTNRCHGRQT